MKPSTSFRHSAFTLLEIMLVVMIIALLMGAAIYTMGDSLIDAQKARVQADIRAIQTQLTVYEAQNGFVPTTEQGLQALVTQPQTEPKPRNWRVYLNELPMDSWQQPYIYEQPGKHNPKSYDLFSAGKDRKRDTSDDIGNWKAAPSE
jgi:general secretion pathway protein G